MKYKVVVEWSMMAVVEVEAASLDEAIENLQDDLDSPLPTNGGYVENSFCVNKDFTIEENS